MTRNELIAKVALDLVRDHNNREPEGTLRFCMVGLEASIVCSIASAVMADSEIQRAVTVKIAPLFDPESLLPEQTRSEESITHWRHCLLPPPYRGVLFAASQKELQRNDKSIEKVTKIETDTLRSRYSSWLECVGLTDSVIDEGSRKHIIAAIRSADHTHAARTIEMFSDFVLGIGESILSGRTTVAKAIDEALPHIRLPRNSGDFDRIPQAKRANTNEWNKIFSRLNGRIRPLLVRENDQGELIPAEDLDKNYEELRTDCTAQERAAIEGFLAADVRHEDWSDAQRDLANLNWHRISPLFHGVNKRSTPKSLGERTLDFFEEWYKDILDDEERILLSPPFPREPSDDLRQFFESYRQHLANDKRLSGAWEKFIYRNPRTFRDFLVGLVATVHSLRSRTRDTDLSERKIEVKIPNSEIRRSWTAKNSNVMRYFSFRYRGLQELLGDNVSLDFGRLDSNYFPHIAHELTRCTSRSKEARSLKFEVTLDPQGANEKLLFYWEMPVDAVATAMPDDLLFVANRDATRALLPTAHIARQPVSAKGGIQRIDLDDMTSIRDVRGTNGGQFVSPNDDSGDRSEEFLSNLNDLAEQLGTDDARSLKTAFDSFVKNYTAAIRDWVAGSAGISSEAFFQQAEAFGGLLVALREHANNDKAREGMWKEMLRLGVANFAVGSPAAIVTPWHPLRLLEIGVKAKQASKLINDVLQANEGDVFRADLLVEQVQLDLSSNYYPEVCVAITNNGAHLVEATGTSFDYTLVEIPLRSRRPGGDDSLDINPNIAAKAFGSIGEQYLTLLPHERSNFSIVLYNSESKALPSALASELASKLEKASELQCDLLLTHSDASRVRQIYEQQNVAAGDGESSVVASEATRNFLSRLRVGFLDESDLEKSDSDRQADLVALQDVVGRNAQLAWKRVSHNTDTDLDPLIHYPGRWSRRRPVGHLDAGTAVYLACPEQPQTGQIYLNALHGFLEGDNAVRGDVVPAREINLRDEGLRKTLQRTHQIGEWVVNFDQLVDRRMLAKNKISVIRHVRKKHLDRNIVVSTTSRPKLLQVLLNNRLERLDPELAAGDTKDEFIQLLIDRANQLSGQVVMRAARYGHYTNELIGIVLSMERVRAAIGGPDLPSGWYFLDDCATWFGQREEQIADIMAIAPRIENGQPVLKVAISEAKFVRSDGYRTHARKSAKQLQETVARMGRAIDSAQNRIDRNIWLHRIGDFMIEGVEPFVAAAMNGMNLYQWSQQVRQDKIPIQLRGFSHVFVHDDEESVDASGPVPLQGAEHCDQEIIDKRGVVKALRSLASNLQEAQPDGSSSEQWSEAIVSAREGSHETSFAGEDVGVMDETATPDVRKPSSSEREGGPRSDSAGAASDAIVESELDSSPHDPSSGEKPITRQSVSSKISKDLLKKWPSAELARWVSAGKLPGHEDADEKNWLNMTVRALQRALRGYDMTAEFVDARLTPNAARVRLRGSDDLTVPKVEKRRQELLTSHAIDVINVLAAPMEIVIMVARPSRKVLRLRDLWRQRDIPEEVPRSNSSLLLGARESDGELLYLNVGKEFGGQQPHGPHTLIAGETGSGKGVLVQCLLLDICATNAPENARIQMIDPKSGIDFPWLRRMPHLDGDLITDQDAATHAFETLVVEMERRNKLLAAAGVTKLSHYNQKVDSAERLPRIWLFHDELADWMMAKEYRESVARNASRLGVKARAAGINLVLVTQRPDRDALPMQLRANLTNRLVLKVADKRNSVLVLDEPGAERLLGRGHLAAKLSGEGKVVFAQVPFAKEEEIEELSRTIERAWATED